MPSAISELYDCHNSSGGKGNTCEKAVSLSCIVPLRITAISVWYGISDRTKAEREIANGPILAETAELAER